MIGPSVNLLRECRAEAFVDASVEQLERLLCSISRTPPAAVEDRALANLVLRHRLVRARLERHRQLSSGAL